MGLCLGGQRNSQTQRTQKQIPNIKSNIENVDVVKVKLKHARDRIKNFINAKNKDIEKINQQLKQKLPAYQQTKNKKPLVPFLQARKNLQKQIQTAQVRLKLINTKIDEVQMSKMNADTVNVLDQSNKYIKDIQTQLQAKDWRNVLEQAQQKYQIQWPNDSEEVQDDPAFQQMWKQIGGQKIIQKKSVNVQVSRQNVTQKQKQRNVMLA